ncbi:MAG: MBL fold metallo-hydrolase [Clostridia bacterium]|nr:MBL fold metallo-hydrolase [Clostridia bacterium]
MKILKYNLGDLSVNCYVIINEKTNNAIAIDIGGDANFLKLEELKHGFKITNVLLTHGHFDHIGGVFPFFKRGAKVYMGEKELDFITDSSKNLSTLFGVKLEKFEAIGVRDAGELLLEDIKVKVIETPGHTEGSVSYVIENKIFDGDVLFEGSFGRIDFPTGNAQKLIKSCKKLFGYSGFVLCPGHGNETNVDEEKLTNPILSYD